MGDLSSVEINFKKKLITINDCELITSKICETALNISIIKICITGTYLLNFILFYRWTLINLNVILYYLNSKYTNVFKISKNDWNFLYILLLKYCTPLFFIFTF